ncbi:MAG: hypothetical protein AUJ28_01385 [Parcubacteria group bacterium CG1_02_37_51]|uniref:Uncharacterized protein n=2 Tax=Candidatus Komeiliibacteriota TaxID=1817908 RepID=A0A2M8DQB6_9BACT|nr:MAG: hypothetical protein AUJ28_01385 [Parcubacteria group bacterium CG1_02_37_51]PIY95382.1 MAG: hypothetical protein COY67_00240 [Candidatus Komeilibacteria bacterium CG_4_10_14_0_8_um_filter_37_78]PJC01097.1 MAG: hypothetical protein CO073_04355 [Candidatus Komeilibacteria bacterium CG_4_9_14_0_8_um_filter_36_9]
MDKIIPNLEKPPVTPARPESEGSFNIETKTEQTVETNNDLPTAKPVSDQATISTPEYVPQDQLLAKVEEILANDLGEFYLDLDPVKQEEFKQKGEEAATKINDLLKQAKVRAKEIIRVITEWLRIVPGLNVFFIEQSAKIKTDKILLENNKNKPHS